VSLQFVKLTAETTALGAACVDPLIPSDRSLDYTWSRVDGPAFDLGGVTNLKTLYIAPGLLVPGERYVFAVRASYKLRPELSTTATVEVLVARGDLVASISSGFAVCVVCFLFRSPLLLSSIFCSDRTFSIASQKPLVLDGSESFDVDETGFDNYANHSPWC
jgi:hypothetical protein